MKNISKISKNIEKEFDKQPLYDSKYVKNKVKPYKGKINTHFYGKKPPK